MSSMWSRLKGGLGRRRLRSRYSLSEPKTQQDAVSDWRFRDGVFAVMDYTGEGPGLRERVLHIEQAENIGTYLADHERRGTWEQEAQGRIFVRAHLMPGSKPFDRLRAEQALRSLYLLEDPGSPHGAEDL